MGFLTTITPWNDALHRFKEDPKAFAEALFQGIDKANRTHQAESVGFQGYCNYIEVQPSRHADDHTVYVHSGNSMFNLNGYGKDMEELTERNPDLAEKMLKQAEAIIDEARRKIKDRKRALKKESAS